MYQCLRVKDIKKYYILFLLLMDKLIDLSNKLNLFIRKETNNIIKRNRNVSLYDAVLFRLLLSSNKNTQESVTGDINYYNKKSIHRSSYVDKINKLDTTFYKKMINIIDSIDSKNNTYSKEIIAVDGTYVNTISKVKNINVKPNKKNNSTTLLISGLYNVSYNYPITIDLINHKNERKAFIEQLNNNNSNNSIYVFDRGYYSNDMFYKLHSLNIHFICRIKMNSLLIKKNKIDSVSKIFYNGTQFKIRIIKYSINNNDYYIASNLFDINEFSVDKIKQIYHDRWTIEEYFKHIKKHTKIDNINGKNINNLYSIVYSTLIMSKLTYKISSIISNLKLFIKTKYKINNSLLTYGIYNHLLYNLIYNIEMNSSNMTRFIKSYVSFIRNKPNRHFKRECKSPNLKSYHKNSLKQKSKNMSNKSIIEMYKKKESMFELILKYTHDILQFNDIIIKNFLIK